ncbi:MAG: hypothetical protein QW146_01335 [Candidatus Bathyarchaeia archaeon]
MKSYSTRYRDEGSLPPSIDRFCYVLLDTGTLVSCQSFADPFKELYLICEKEQMV